MAKTRRTFSREFKIRAVKSYLDGEMTIPQLAGRLLVSQDMLRRWVREYREDPENAFPGKGFAKSTQIKYAKLRQELSRITQERNILKKALKVFSENLK